MLHKTPHFEAEQEVRAFFFRGHPQAQGFFCDPSTPISTLIRPTQYVFDVGYPVTINPRQLITGIVVDPLGDSVLFDRVRAIVADAGIDIPVEQSTIHRVEYLEQMLIRERLSGGS